MLRAGMIPVLRAGVPRAAPLAARRSLAQAAQTGRLSHLLDEGLATLDPEVFEVIEREKCRQRTSLTLIPSENYTSSAVLEALGSVMQNKYSEGYPGARYYGGNEWIDAAESLCQKRALAAFHLDPSEWGVNVQPLSGSPANMYVFTALLNPHDRIMGLDLPHGGHLSHGFQTETKKVSAVSIYFETFPYRLDESTGIIDYDALQKSASIIRPKLIIAGASAYSRNYDYARMKAIADSVNAYLMSDMAHIAGLVAGGVTPSPFEHSDVVTTTTHKSLRGPRGSMIFFRKGVRKADKKGEPIMYNLEAPINQAVFPGHQGGPHNHTITALAVALKQAASPEFKAYQHDVLRNCQAMYKAFSAKGYSIVSGGTDNHLLLIDLKPNGIDGARVEAVMEKVSIALNKNTVPGDKSAFVPGGIRMGTPALTTRGLGVADMETVADFVHRGVQLAIELNKQVPGKKLADFKSALYSAEPAGVTALRKEVEAFSASFPTVGFTEESMKYPSTGQ
ncbi:hypothetical protein KFE25_005374 [Diacronema lutheri]|uniref:glycine hydroxymethyltransferase n=1 Tax=Diacronema lutheri TaxID=2081491 RepID=A0A7R9UQ27_DIALT|nr:hypothetical protein KFE25_005374 [Diacronema lutheri]